MTSILADATFTMEEKKWGNIMHTQSNWYYYLTGTIDQVDLRPHQTVQH